MTELFSPDAFLSPPISEGEWAGWSTWLGEEPFETHVGPFYTRRGEAGGMICGCRILQQNVRSGGSAHGGTLMSFADYSLFMIAFDVLAGSDGITVSLTSDFLSTVQLGARLIARGQVVKAGRSLIFIQGAIETDDIPVVAFSGIIKVLGKR